LRIIGGRYRGRNLESFKGRDVRPTADRVRESLFNILARRTHDACVLDLFSGTGALGIEALSRGARMAVFVDNSVHSLRVLRKNLDRCALSDDCTQVIRWDITRNLECLRRYPQTFDLVFLDPPYHREVVQVAMRHLVHSQCLAAEALLVVEHEAQAVPEMESGPFTCTERRRYGRTGLTFFSFLAASPEA
jgi:16S rRNA (guanine966-N2)-methyltransferase